MSEPGPFKLFWGRALMAVGGLWCALCGGCTVLFTFPMLGSIFSGRWGEVLGWIGLCLALGAICAAPGAILFLIGRALARERP